jgi:hypothetical protein
MPAHHRYGLLLCLIGASLVFQLAVPDQDWSRLVIVVLQGVTLVAALRVSAVRPSLVRAASVIVAIAAVGSLIAELSGGGDGENAVRLVNALLVGIAPAAIAVGVVRNVREDRGVTVGTMFGVLCIYLLLGMFFAFLYAAMEALGSQPVFTQAIDPGQADFLYFSFSTLTTTGFGDLTAGTGLGRSTAITEALLGQVYLVTIVAAIVTNLRPRTASSA